MTDVAAAIGLKQFERYPEMLKRRKEIIGKYDAALKPLGQAVASCRRGGGWGAVASLRVAGAQCSRLGWGGGRAGGAPRAELNGPPARCPGTHPAQSSCLHRALAENRFPKGMMWVD